MTPPITLDNPRRLSGDDPDLARVLALIRDSFAYMDGVIDPPSSMHRMTEKSLCTDASRSEIWVIGTPPIACMVLTPRPDTLYLGKLAVASAARGQGLARRMIDHAAARAAALGLPSLTLQTRIELTANHATFAALGFTQTGRTRHDGYDRDTSITFTLSVAADRLSAKGATT